MAKNHSKPNDSEESVGKLCAGAPDTSKALFELVRLLARQAARETLRQEAETAE